MSQHHCVALGRTTSRRSTRAHWPPSSSAASCTADSFDHPVFDRRPAKLRILQPLRHQADARSVPPQQLHPVHPLGAEHVDGAAERIGTERRLHDGCQAVGLFAEVHRARCHENLEVCSCRDHEVLRNARSTATIASVSAWPMTRTTASAIAISIVPNERAVEKMSVATIVQTPRSPPAQTLARRHRPRAMAIGCLCDDAAAVPDSQLDRSAGAAFPPS